MQATIVFLLTTAVLTCSALRMPAKEQFTREQLSARGEQLMGTADSISSTPTNGSTVTDIMKELNQGSRFKRSTSCYSTALYGGSGGGAFSEHPDICAATVISIIIRSGSLVDGIQLKYNLADGTYYQGSHHGGYGGGYEEFWLDFNAGERVVGVLGKSGNLVDQLGFITSLGRTIGPYGGSGGSSFKVDGCQVRGIYGRSGSLLDSIGFYCSAV